MGVVAKSIVYLHLFFLLLERKEEEVLNFRHADLENKSI